MCVLAGPVRGQQDWIMEVQIRKQSFCTKPLEVGAAFDRNLSHEQTQR